MYGSGSWLVLSLINRQLLIVRMAGGGAVIGRLRWLMRQIHCGRDANVRVSYNDATRTEKLTFRLQKASAECFGHRSCLLGAIGALEAAMTNAVITDKGHTSSDGNNVVCFWVKPLRFGTGNDDLSDATVEKDPVDDAGLARPHTHTSGAMVVSNAMDVPLTRLGSSIQAAAGTVGHDLALGSDGNSTKHGVVHVVEQPLVCNDESVPLGAALADVLAKLGQLRSILPPPDLLQNSWVDLYYSSISSLESDLQQHLVPSSSVAPAVD